MHMTMKWDEIEKVLNAATCNVLIFGGPSMGKSFISQALGGYAITIHDGTPADELRGHWVPAKNGFAWHDGVGLKAWKEGCPLVVNEIDKGSDEVRSIMHVIADNPETAKMTLPTNETVTPKPGFRVIGTMNGAPEDLPDALRSRFPVQIFVDEPHPNAIARLPEYLQSAAKQSATCVDLSRRIPLRSWYAFVSLSEALGQDLALKAVFAERADEILDTLTLLKAKDKSDDYSGGSDDEDERDRD